MDDSIIYENNNVPFSVRYHSEIFVVCCTIGLIILALGMIFVVMPTIMPIIMDTMDSTTDSTADGTHYTYTIDADGLYHVLYHGEPTGECMMIVPSLKYVIPMECE